MIPDFNGEVEKDQVPPRRQLIAQIQAVDYLMGYARGLGFDSVFWEQRRMISESG